MLKINPLLTLLISILLCCAPMLSQAQTAEGTEQEQAIDDGFSWQWSAGPGLIYSPSILKDDENPAKLENMANIAILVDVYYKGFFIQTNHRRINGMAGNTEVGYQLFTAPDWELDLLIKTYLFGYTPSDIVEETENEDSILAGLSTRQFGEGLGLRYSKFYDDARLSVEVASLVSIHAGNDWVAEVFYSHLIPYRNWDIYVGAGLSYYTDDVVNYYTGINAEEATANRPFYQPNDGIKAQLEVYAQKPLSEKWTLNIGVNTSYYSSSIVDSPIVDKRMVTTLAVGAMYAF